MGYSGTLEILLLKNYLSVFSYVCGRVSVGVFHTSFGACRCQRHLITLEVVLQGVVS